MKTKFTYNLLLPIIILLAFAVRIINLSYNSPFRDEAIYIVLGKLGVFDHDWWSYNAQSWLGGSLYIYPIITALAYAIGGITGSRLLNIFLNLSAICLIFKLACQLSRPEKNQRIGSLTAAALTGGASISLYVARLATYDMPSFCLFFCQPVLFAKSKEEKKK